MRVHVQLQPHIGLCLVAIESPPVGCKCRVTVTRHDVTIVWEGQRVDGPQPAPTLPSADGGGTGGTCATSLTVATSPGFVDLSQPVRYTQYRGVLALRVPLQRDAAAGGGLVRPTLQPRPERVHAGIARKLPATLACSRCLGGLSTPLGVINRAVSLPTEGWAELCEYISCSSDLAHLATIEPVPRTVLVGDTYLRVHHDDIDQSAIHTSGRPHPPPSADQAGCVSETEAAADDASLSAPHSSSTSPSTSDDAGHARAHHAHQHNEDDGDHDCHDGHHRHHHHHHHHHHTDVHDAAAALLDPPPRAVAVACRRCRAPLGEVEPPETSGGLAHFRLSPHALATVSTVDETSGARAHGSDSMEEKRGTDEPTTTGAGNSSRTRDSVVPATTLQQAVQALLSASRERSSRKVIVSSDAERHRSARAPLLVWIMNEGVFVGAGAAPSQSPLQPHPAARVLYVQPPLVPNRRGFTRRVYTASQAKIANAWASDPSIVELDIEPALVAVLHFELARSTAELPRALRKSAETGLLNGFLSKC